jgi:Protein of unknown function (DUF3096)
VLWRISRRSKVSPQLSTLALGRHHISHGTLSHLVTRNALATLSFQFHRQSTGEYIMTISIAHLQPIVALVAGILILVIPRLLNIIVAVYLILIGLLGIGLFR